MTLQQHHLNLSLESVFKGDSWTMFVACLEQQLALPHLLPLPLLPWPLSCFCCASVSKLSTQIDDVNNDDTKIDLLHDWQTSSRTSRSMEREEEKLNGNGNAKVGDVAL